MLGEKDLVKIMGREDLPGRPLIYGTTKKFLEVFDLQSLEALPKLKEIEALGVEEHEPTTNEETTSPIGEATSPDGETISQGETISAAGETNSPQGETISPNGETISQGETISPDGEAKPSQTEAGERNSGEGSEDPPAN